MMLNLYVLIGHLSVSFGDISIQILCTFKNLDYLSRVVEL
jgi:hypothetical protein